MTGRTLQWLPDRCTQLPLPRLFDDDDEADEDRWSFAIVALDGHGRMALPAATVDRRRTAADLEPRDPSK